MALEAGTVDLSDGYDASHPIRYGRYRIRDFHPENRFLTVPEIFYHSSNIGTAKMALDVGTERQKSFLGKFGLLKRADLHLPEVGAPIVPARWGELETMTIAFGHGLAVSPLQLAVAAAALVNGGCKVTPTLISVSNRQADTCERLVSEETSSILRQLLRQVVEEGTGRKADVKGFPVGGKTGTAEKARAGGYSRRSLISSFLGVFPAQNPEYVVLAVLDEPKGTKETFNFATAGWTAAPTVGNIVRRIAPMVGVDPIRESDILEPRQAQAGRQRLVAQADAADTVSSRFTR
jgi:cell division protein FtsI (penicillin-binding protein 3)